MGEACRPARPKITCRRPVARTTPMSKPVLQIRCPCCKKPIEIDTRTGRARAMATRDTGLDQLIDAHKTEGERLGGLFDSARDEHQTEAQRLDELFRKAQEESKDDKGKPRTPFDLE